MAQAMDWLALLASWRGEWERAGELWREAMAMLEELGALEECVAGAWAPGRGPAARGRSGRRCRRLPAGGGIRPTGGPAGPASLPWGWVRSAGSKGISTRHAAGWRWRRSPSRRRSAPRAAGPRLTALGRLDGPRASRGPGSAIARRWPPPRQSPLGGDLADAAEGLAGAGPADGHAKQAALLLGVAVALRGTALAGDPDVARSPPKPRGDRARRSPSSSARVRR